MTQTAERPAAPQSPAPFKGLVHVPKGEHFSSTRPSFIKACYGNRRIAELVNFFLVEASSQVKNPKNGCKTVTLELSHKAILSDVSFSSETTLIKFLKMLNVWGYVLSQAYGKTFTVNIEKINQAIDTPPDPKDDPCATERKPRAPRGTNKAESSKNETRETLELCSPETEAMLQVLLDKVSLLEKQISQMELSATEVKFAAPQMELWKSSQMASQASQSTHFWHLRILEITEDNYRDSFCASAIAATPTKKSVLLCELDPFLEDQGTLSYASYSQSMAINAAVHNVSPCLSSLPSVSSSAYVAHPDHSWLLLDSLIAPTVMVIQTASEPWALSREDKQRGKIARAVAEQWKAQGFSLRVTLEQQPSLVQQGNNENKDGSGILGTGPRTIGNINVNTSNENNNHSHDGGTTMPMVAVQTPLIPGTASVQIASTAKTVRRGSKTPVDLTLTSQEGILQFPAQGTEKRPVPKKYTEEETARMMDLEKEMIRLRGCELAERIADERNHLHLLIKKYGYDLALKIIEAFFAKNQSWKRKINAHNVFSAAPGIQADWKEAMGQSQISNGFSQQQSASTTSTVVPATPASQVDPNKMVLWHRVPYKGTAASHWYLYEDMPLSEALEHGYSKLPGDIVNMIRTQKKLYSIGKLALPEEAAEYLASLAS